MRKKVISASKRMALVVILPLVMTGTLFGQQEKGNPVFVTPINDQRVILGDDHEHSWDDLRLLLVTLVEVNDSEIRWKHQTPSETKTGQWSVGRVLGKSNRGIKSDRIHPGKEYVAVYCSHCQTAIWLYDGK
jgi:hypothetical protein